AEEAEIITLIRQAELAARAHELNVADNQVCLRRSAVGDDRALNVRDDGLNVGLVETKDGGAVERHTVDELGERILDVCERVILVEVLAIDGSDDGNDRSKKQEGTIAFVGFNDEVLTLPEPCRGASLIDFAADNECGIKVRGTEN